MTLDELLAWMLAVPGIPPSSPRFAYYVRGYDVLAKIRQAKSTGTFEDTISSLETPAPLRLAAAREFVQHARLAHSARAR